MRQIDELTNHELDTGIVGLRKIKPLKHLKKTKHTSKLKHLQKIKALDFYRRQAMRRRLRQIESKLDEAMQCEEA